MVGDDAAAAAVMVGDRPSTDGLFAAHARLPLRAGVVGRHAAGHGRRSRRPIWPSARPRCGGRRRALLRCTLRGIRVDRHVWQPRAQAAPRRRDAVHRDVAEQAEQLVKELVQDGEVRRKDSEKLVEAARRARPLGHRAAGGRGAGRGRQAARSVRRPARRRSRTVIEELAEKLGVGGTVGRGSGVEAPRRPPHPLRRRRRPRRRRLPRRRPPGEEGRRPRRLPAKKAAGEEGTGEEGCRQEGTGEEGCRQEGAGQEAPDVVASRQRLDAELVRRQLVGTSRTDAAERSTHSRVLVNGARRRQGVAAGPRRRRGRRRRADGRASSAAAARSSTRRSTRSASTSPDGACSTPARRTGGFTDCLLQRGARTWWRSTSATDSCTRGSATTQRVTVIERFNVRDVTRTRSAGRAAGRRRPVVHLARPRARRRSSLRASRAATSCCSSSRSSRPGGWRCRGARHHHRPGDPRAGARRGATTRSSTPAARCCGWVDSPITGGDGNREFLVHATHPAARMPRVSSVLLVAHHERAEAAAPGAVAAEWLHAHAATRRG